MDGRVAGIKEETEKKGRENHSLVHVLNGLNAWGWSRQERSQSFIRVSHVGAGARILEPSFTVFLGALAGRWVENGVSGALASIYMQC